jgi:hypothetical protein
VLLTVDTPTSPTPPSTSSSSSSNSNSNSNSMNRMYTSQEYYHMDYTARAITETLLPWLQYAANQLLLSSPSSNNNNNNWWLNKLSREDLERYRIVAHYVEVTCVNNNNNNLLQYPYQYQVPKIFLQATEDYEYHYQYQRYQRNHSGNEYDTNNNSNNNSNNNNNNVSNENDDSTPSSSSSLSSVIDIVSNKFGNSTPSNFNTTALITAADTSPTTKSSPIISHFHQQVYDKLQSSIMTSTTTTTSTITSIPSKPLSSSGRVRMTSTPTPSLLPADCRVYNEVSFFQGVFPIDIVLFREVSSSPITSSSTAPMNTVTNPSTISVTSKPRQIIACIEIDGPSHYYPSLLSPTVYYYKRKDILKEYMVRKYTPTSLWYRISSFQSPSTSTTSASTSSKSSSLEDTAAYYDDNMHQHLIDCVLKIMDQQENTWYQMWSQWQRNWNEFFCWGLRNSPDFDM